MIPFPQRSQTNWILSQPRTCGYGVCASVHDTELRVVIPNNVHGLQWNAIICVQCPAFIQQHVHNLDLINWEHWNRTKLAVQLARGNILSVNFRIIHSNGKNSVKTPGHMLIATVSCRSGKGLCYWIPLLELPPGARFHAGTCRCC